MPPLEDTTLITPPMHPHHPSLVHRIHGHCGPKQLCYSSHEVWNKLYCEACEMYCSSNGCHGVTYVYVDGSCCELHHQKSKACRVSFVRDNSFLLWTYRFFIATRATFSPRNKKSLAKALIVVLKLASTANNGHYNAESGVGVFFGPSSKHNLSFYLDFEDYHNSQRAELYAAIMAFQRSINLVEDMEEHNTLFTPEYWHHVSREIVVLTDSSYVCQGFNDRMDNWEQSDWVNHKGQPIPNADLFRILYDLKYPEGGHGCQLSVVKIPREENQAADALAKQSLP